MGIYAQRTELFLLGASQVWTPPKWWIGLERGLAGVAGDGLWFHQWAHYGSSPGLWGLLRSVVLSQEHMCVAQPTFMLWKCCHTRDEIAWHCSPNVVVSGAQSSVQALTEQHILSSEDRHGRSRNQDNVIVFCPSLQPTDLSHWDSRPVLICMSTLLDIDIHLSNWRTPHYALTLKRISKRRWIIIGKIGKDKQRKKKGKPVLHPDFSMFAQWIIRLSNKTMIVEGKRFYFVRIESNLFKYISFLYSYFANSLLILKN